MEELSCAAPSQESSSSKREWRGLTVGDATGVTESRMARAVTVLMSPSSSLSLPPSSLGPLLDEGDCSGGRWAGGHAEAGGEDGGVEAEGVASDALRGGVDVGGSVRVEELNAESIRPGPAESCGAASLSDRAFALRNRSRAALTSSSSTSSLDASSSIKDSRQLEFFAEKRFNRFLEGETWSAADVVADNKVGCGANTIDVDVEALSTATLARPYVRFGGGAPEDDEAVSRVSLMTER